MTHRKRHSSRSPQLKRSGAVSTRSVDHHEEIFVKRKPKLFDSFSNMFVCYECDHNRSLKDTLLLQFSSAINLISVYIYWTGTLKQESAHITHVLDISHLHACQFYMTLTLFSSVFSALYHASKEQRFLILDMLFAHVSILGNFFLAANVWNSFVAFGAVLAFSSLYFFRNPFDNYIYSHSCWHAMCGIANVCFAMGFTQISHHSPFPFSGR
eukprot:TRINITY_DN20999_c0_g1_i1.p1 TRINITY_DN20999_c0_g1~~TRINITY_DN20999_c0_g1_i1.p1  ORF type:complete len:212 (-),score=35.76 TRINITY_DN20999_c0_g1_i1:50-685(-)